MVEPVTWHPAADRATSQALVVEQDRTVVPLSTWVADAAVEATATRRVLQVLTPAHSRLTYPLELLLRDAAGQWVVRTGPEQFRDGITGFRLRWNGQRFVSDLDAPPPADGEPQPGSGDLEVQVCTLHQADESLELGASTATAVRVLTGAAPAGWGVAEPATQPWCPRELTALCREHAPAPTQLVVVGGPVVGGTAVGHTVVGQLRVQRVGSGVLERVRLSGPPAAVVDQDRIDALAAELAGTARSMIVAVQPGRLNGLRTSRPTPPALPYGILIGHPVVAERGVEHARTTPAPRATLLGQGTRQACWCRLDGAHHPPYELLTAVLKHFALPGDAG